ncbi:MAG: hypothetical protein RIA08_07265 [Roseovarius sp.]|uniref:hypothetical protein n=1 Tax=Roseovarius sp. TaxID=1486281 RepID=UPI0032EDA8E9
MTQQAEADANGVHIGRDGYLFLKGGQKGVFSYFTGAKSPRRSSTNVFRTSVEARARFCERTGRRFRMVIFPEKCIALREKIDLPDEFVSLYERSYQPVMAGSEAEKSILYPVEALRAEPRAISRTDTHYAAPGVLGMTEALLADMFPDEIERGMSMLRALLTETPAFFGDLGRKFSDPVGESQLVMKGQAVPITMASNGLKGNDGLMFLVSSPQALSDKTVLVFGDSFFRQLLQTLPVFYQHVVFCRSRYFHYEMVKAVKPDDIFCGLAERYLSHCRADTKRPHFLKAFRF